MQQEMERSIATQRILLVDDDMPSNERLSGMLVRSDFDCRTVDNWIEAIKVLIEHREFYGCIIIGGVIGDVSGAEVARIIRTRFDKLPIIMVSDSDDVFSEIDASCCGISYVLKKNVEEYQLIQTVNKSMLEIDGSSF